jgi:hypothetical protein
MAWSVACFVPGPRLISSEGRGDGLAGRPARLADWALFGVCLAKAA